MRKIKQIVVHCSDSQDSLDIGKAEINQWHIERGWSMIGYHFVVRRNGRIEIGRPIDMVGAHVKGNNKRTIGICWIGRNNITPKQYWALVELCTHLMKEFGLPFDDIMGHCEFDDLKTCPNIDMKRLRGDVLFCQNISEEIKDVVKRSQDK